MSNASRPCCISAEATAARVAMCRACPASSPRWARRSDLPLARCTVLGRAITDEASKRAAECPRGRWPDEAGVVRWAGLRWYGVPMPVRLMLAAKLYPGCGCIVSLKAPLEWLLGRVRSRHG